MKGYIHQIESFGCADGPGSRFIIFMAGCHLRCKYCHNPDSWDMSKGKLIESDELIKDALSCSSYWGKKGGITVSGGEPLVQIDFLIELFKKAKEHNINTCIDTAGEPFTKQNDWFLKFEQLMQLTDILLVDIKHIDEKQHINLTGKTGKNIIEMFKYLDEINKPIWIRHVLVPGITDDDEYLIKTRDFIRTLHNVQRLEVLPYHGLAITKYKELGIDYVLKDTLSPTQERIENAKNILECSKYNGWKN